MNEIAAAANVIRGLAMDAVQAANSGHPGMPMGAADYAAGLFLNHLRYNPDDPAWADRDRFVLSAGHGSALIYSLLHLAGYGLELEELKKFRQHGSRTPGHPEFGHTPGVETTTGPLGQGCANAVGMALAERMLAERFNTDDFTPVDHYTYVICSDGDLMEGISHEAFSLAGHLGLGKLIAIHDFNRITIEGATDLAYSDDVKDRFHSYHWSVIEIDGHDCDEIDKALAAARRPDNERPTLIIAHTHIGHGSPNMHDTSKAHGAPLGPEEIKASKQNLGLPEDEDFFVSDDVRAAFAARAEEGRKAQDSWQTSFEEYRKACPDKAAQWDAFMSGAVPEDLASLMPDFGSDPIATRAASGKVIQELAKAIPQLVGGSADLAPSNNTLIKDVDDVGPGSFGGRNFHFGVREHGMAGIMNGVAAHGGFRIFGGTFFVFLDYCRPSVRLAAMMGLPVIYVFTHDSFYVGEDGPTHQPVEQIASLRCIPNVTVLRPGDATETGAAWVAALKNKNGPTALLLTRHKLPVIDRTGLPAADNLEKGAYTLCQSGEGDPDVLLLASGSEVDLALEAAKELSANCNVRVVSMPSWELFEQQDKAYRDQVIPPACAVKVALEAGSPFGWDKYVGPDGVIIGMDGFGASGPYKALAKHFGFSVENVVSTVKKLQKG